jgi:hypothetical protein
MAQDIPPELMKLMQGGQPPGGAGGDTPPPGGPVSAPMSTPQKNEGEKHAALSQVQMAIDLLEQTLPPFGSESDEGQTVLDALKTLSKTFSSKKDTARGLIPSEIMNLVSGMPKGAGGGMPPPPGAGAPPGAPPGMPPPGGMPPGMPPPPMQ